MRFFGRVISGIVIYFGAVSLAVAGIRIDSPKIRVYAKPGSYASGEIKVDNTGKQEIPIRVYLEDWVYAHADGSKDFMPKGMMPLSCSNWITFYPADFKLAAGKSEIIHYTVNIPADATGGRVCVMFFETEGGDIEQKQEDGSTALVKVFNRVGALFYAEAEGTVNKKAEIRSLDIRQNLNDFIVIATFVNTGNTDITASGTFDVLDNSGIVYVRGAFEDIFTLPGDKAELTSTASSSNLKPGAYDILMTLDFQNGGSLIQEASFTIDDQGSVSGITLKS